MNKNHGARKGQAKVALTPYASNPGSTKISFAVPSSGVSQGLFILNYVELSKVSL